MNSRIIAIIIAFASLLAAVPDSAGRWFYLQRVAHEINLLAGTTSDGATESGTTTAPNEQSWLRQTSAGQNVIVSGLKQGFRLVNAAK